MLGTYDSKDDFPLRKTGTGWCRGFAEVMRLPDLRIPPALKTSLPLHVLKGALISLFLLH